ncbi:MAG TPA: efflux RND transporter permease subunit, partial [Kofleriaceae bacterium]|nr:efflux RND transporter permease subunit [Kofleriaceae bacterium]
LESLQDLVVGQVGDVPVRVRDVAVVLDDFIRAPESGPAQIEVHAQLGVLRMDVAETVRKQLPNLSLPLGVKVTEVPAKSLPAAKQLAVSIVGMDLDELARLADAAIADAKAAGIAGVERDPSPGASEVVLDADRDRAARYGITSADLAETLRLATDDARVGELRLDGEQWPVLMRLSTRDLPTRVTKLFVRSGIGGLVPLNELVAVSNRMATPILRRNRVRAIDLVAPAESVGKVRAIVERAAAKWPEGYRAARPR